VSALRQAKPLKHPLEDAGYAYFVGYLPSFNHLPFWGRFFVERILLPLERYAYRKWNWSCNPHGQALCRTEHKAQEMCLDKPRWFYLRLPVDNPLPEEPVMCGHSFPESKAAKMYDEVSSPWLKERLEEGTELAKRIRELSKT
jgi:hypothetical protein